MTHEDICAFHDLLKNADKIMLAATALGDSDLFRATALYEIALRLVKQNVDTLRVNDSGELRSLTNEHTHLE